VAIDKNEMNSRFIRLAESPEAGFWRFDYNELSHPERVFRAIWELEAEVNNGGFEQYFSNSSGELAPHVVDALRVIGAPAMADIVQGAIDAVGPSTAWHDDDARQAHIDALAPETRIELDSCDQRFMAYPENLMELLYRYVCENRNDIRAAAHILGPDQ
jgi:uncharacterized protein DUF4375